MINTFNDNINLFISERQQESLSILRKTNKEYDILRKTHAENSEEMDRIRKSLPGNDKRFVKDYIEESDQISSIELDRVYVQGYKDCLSLILYLDV